jgi:hypothetical protein
VPKLEVASDEAWQDCLGVSPQTEDISGDEYVRELRIPVTAAEQVQITWDVTDDSVRVRHHRDGRIVSDLFREMATLLTVAKLGSVRKSSSSLAPTAGPGAPVSKFFLRSSSRTRCCARETHSSAAVGARCGPPTRNTGSSPFPIGPIGEAGSAPERAGSPTPMNLFNCRLSQAARPDGFVSCAPR